MNRFTLVSLFSSLILITLGSCQSYNESYDRQTESRNNDIKRFAVEEEIPLGYYKVNKVSDGDTFWCIDNKGLKVKVRLIGIDAPESRNVFNVKKQPFGKAASTYAEDLLLHKLVRLEFDVDSLDRFGRTLAYAYLADQTFINEKIVLDGFATALTYPPNVKHEHRFVKAQRTARQKKRGIWGPTILE